MFITHMTNNHYFQVKCICYSVYTSVNHIHNHFKHAAYRIYPRFRHIGSGEYIYIYCLFMVYVLNLFRKIIIYKSKLHYKTMIIFSYSYSYN